jgi:hypothetical protein
MNGNMNSREKLLNEIGMLSFAALETNLFLDGHTDNRGAIKYFNKVNKELKEKTERYEAEYGPLTAGGNKGDNEWKWATYKWPWQMED